MTVIKNKKIMCEITTPHELILLKEDENFKSFTDITLLRTITLLESYDSIPISKLQQCLAKIFNYDAKSQSWYNINFWIYRGWTREEAILKIKEIQISNAKKFVNKVETGIILHNFSREYLLTKYPKSEVDDIFRNNGIRGSSSNNIKRREDPENYLDIYPTQIGYWIKKGYTEEESKKLISERQRTFSLEICIEKYGKEEGTRVWKERQDNWQETLNSKSQEEIDDINSKKRITLDNMIRKWGGDEAKERYIRWIETRGEGLIKYQTLQQKGKLYYIKFYNDDLIFWKIGITSNAIVGGRFDAKEVHYYKYNLHYDVIFFEEFETYRDAYLIEQYLLNKYSDNRIIINYNGFATTEAFNTDVFKGHI